MNTRKMKKTKRAIKKIIGLIIFILLTTIKLLGLHVYVGRIYSSRIGHLIFNFENWIEYTKSIGGNRVTFFILDKSIANNLVLNLLNQERSVIFLGASWTRVYEIISKNSLLSEFLVSWKIQQFNLINVATLPQRYFLPMGVMDKFSNRLKKYGKSAGHVCFHNRDSAYLSRANIQDDNFHDYRDFSFSCYKRSFIKLAELNMCPIRVGQFVCEQNHDFDYLDLSGDNYSEELNIAAISTAHFFVTGNTGISFIARLFRKPVLAVNYAPVRLHEVSALPCDSIIVPKKIWDTLANRYLNLREICEVGSNFDIHYSGDFFSDNGLQLHDNDEFEILEAVEEMYTRQNGTYQSSEFDLDCMNALESMFQESIEFRFLSDVLRIRFSSSFLMRNKYLLGSYIC